MITYDKLIKDLKEFTKYRGLSLVEQYTEQALISLLEDNKEFETLWMYSPDAGEFQKSLRQVGTDNQNGVDWAVWNLIHSSKVFWDVVNEIDIFDGDF